MGLADRDYMRKRKVQWDESRGEMRLADERVVASVGRRRRLAGWPSWWRSVVGRGLWWYRTGGPPLPAVEVPAATVQDAPGGPVAMVESDNPVLVGRVTRVLDGDTIEVALSSGPIRVRFGSVDAPEKKQPWGREAREALTRKLGDREVELDVVSQDQYDRLVAVVGLDDENVNAWLVRQGHAWAYRQYAKDKSYCAWEAEARAGSAGCGPCRPRSGTRRGNFERCSADGPAASPTIRTRRSRSASRRCTRSRCRLPERQRARVYGADPQRLPDQGQHQRQRQDLSPARQRLVRSDEDRRVEGRTVVLYGRRGTRGGVAGAERVVPIRGTVMVDQDPRLRVAGHAWGFRWLRDRSGDAGGSA